MKNPHKKYTRQPGSNPPGNPHPTGNTSKMKTAKEFQEKIERYFKECDKKRMPYTVTGMAFALGFTTRLAIINYENEEKHHDIEEGEKKLIVNTIKKAKLKIEEYLEINLIEGKQVAGTIFNLKNNYGWIDRQDVQHGGDVIINVKGIKRI